MNDQPEYHTDMPVGEILRRARVHYGQSLGDVEASLRIRAVQLDAIESGDLERLPGRVYAIGFVRTYAEYLGFDPEKMVKLFKKQAKSVRAEPALNFSLPASESKIPGPVMVVLASVMAALVLSAYIYSLWPDRSVVSEIPDIVIEERGDGTSKVPMPQDFVVDGTAMAVSSDGEVQSAAQSASDSSEKNHITRQDAEQQTGIILHMLENSWVEIRDANNKNLVSKVLQQGEQYFIPDRPDLTLAVGNAAAIQFVVEGVKIPPLGNDGQVRSDIPLNAEALKALAPINR